MPSVIKLVCTGCIAWKRQVKIFLLSVKISLCCFCCAMSVSEFFLCNVDRLFWLFGLWYVLNKSVDLFGCVMNSEKLIMEKENQNKTNSPEGVSYYTLMCFLMMLSVILLSMLMILLSTLNVIRHLICGNN